MKEDFSVPSDSLTEQRIGAIVTTRDGSGPEYRALVIAVEGDTALVHPFEKLATPSGLRLLRFGEKTSSLMPALPQ